MSLRDALLNSLKTLPGTRELHLHVLVSSPRKHQTLYPFARPRPRSYLQDVLVLLSEQVTPDSPRILVTAIEACVYNIPSTSCAVLYVSKVDSTGQSISPSPTSTLVRSLLLFYADPSTRPLASEHLWIHLFARAQSQYLFPNSAEYPGKRPLSDIKLCVWWKRVLTEVADELDARAQSKATTRLYYILPGYGQVEADYSLKFAGANSSPTSASHPWIYGHPYSQTEIPLPCPPDARNLGHFIPSFEDDPKSRFMDEIAYTTDGEGIKSPARKRRRTASNSERDPKGEQGEEAGQDNTKGVDDTNEPPHGELARVSPDEFWERMSFRQECVAGAVTGFFSLGITSFALDGSSTRTRSAVSPLAPQPGQVSSQINKRVMTSLLTGVEFSTVERAIRGTETLESAIKGLCEGITPYSAPSTKAPAAPLLLKDLSDADRRTPEPESSSSSSATLLAPPRTPPPRMANGKRVVPDISPNPFPEPETSLETYRSHIYGSVCISNVGLPSKTEGDKNRDGPSGDGSKAPASHVTVLTVRKKKKRAD